MAKYPWTPWRQVVQLRPDLLSGELPLHLFAADLYEVLMQNGKRPVYEDPEKFFALTFPTHNLRALVRDVALRVAGKNDKAVRQLERTYGGGKTHTLITLRHLLHDPENLPDVPAVREFGQAIGETPARARVAALCFDKFDPEKGMEIRAPDGSSRWLRQSWSALAWQIAGADGLRLLHPDDRAEERNTPPAENLLTDLLEIPVKEDLGVLVLLDEVLMYARQKVNQDRGWGEVLVDFFQCLTQAATKVDRCCVVASLLASDLAQSEILGRKLQADLYDIFGRNREEAVEPVTREDAAELLRRRLFTPESIENRQGYHAHVIAALQGIAALDEHTRNHGQAAEEEFLKSYPFHPRLTDVFYTKWTSIGRHFQRTRGVLRTFTLALREAAQWDDSPLIGPAIFLGTPDAAGLSEATRELVTVADRQETEGQAVAWTGILTGELTQAREIQLDSIGLKQREIERAVIATFLHSQPIGQSARTRDLQLLVGEVRTDRIELEKGFARWSQTSYWLDDRQATTDGSLPTEWRLGNRPNLNQMHGKAVREIPAEVVDARLLAEISQVKALTQGVGAAGVRAHTLPERPRDIEDDGQFHYAVMPPGAASESGKPSSEARRFIDETTGPNKPRVHRNAVVLLCPSRDGLEAARARLRDYLAWEQVQQDLRQQQEGGTVDIGRQTTLAAKIDSAAKLIAPAIKQAYCIVVTVDERNEVHAFRITVTDEPLFQTIKEDKRSRMQDTAINAEALLPGGPYDLWRQGETSRRVKDLAGAFAQLPQWPKMLKAQAINDTLAGGCEQGNFVLKLARPDRSFRTWWRCRPDDEVMREPSLELVLPENAELAELEAKLLEPETLPDLWEGDELTVPRAVDYFNGDKVVQVDKGDYTEPMAIPQAGKEVIHAAISKAVAESLLWLVNGPATVLGEEIPAGVLSDAARLRRPPPSVPAPDLLPANLPEAWSDGMTTALAVAAALAQKNGFNLPWKTVREAITSALKARFLEQVEGSAYWPCDYPAAGAVKLVEAKAGERQSGGAGVAGEGGGTDGTSAPGVRVGSSELEPHELQDLVDAMQQILEVKAQTGVPVRFHLRVEVGESGGTDPAEAAQQISKILGDIKDDWCIQ